MKTTPVFLIVIFFLLNCHTGYSGKKQSYGGWWTDCVNDFSIPFSKTEIFEEKSASGFWVTTLDSTDSSAVPGVIIKYGLESDDYFTTGRNGSVWIESQKTDTIYAQYIGLNSGFFYRYSSTIDSVVIYLTWCTIMTHD